METGCRMSYHGYSQAAGCWDTRHTSHQQCQPQGTFNSPRRLGPPRYVRARYGAAAELSQMIDEHLASWQPSQASNDRPTSKGTVIVDWDGSGNPTISYRKNATVVDEVLVPLIAPAPLNRGASSLAKADSVKQSRRNAAAYMRKPLPFLPTDERSSKQIKRKHLVVGSTYPFPQHATGVSEASVSSRRHAQHFPARPSIQSPAHPQRTQYTTGDGFTANYHLSRYSQALDSHHRPYIQGYDESSRFKYDYDGHIFHAHRSPSGSLLSPRGSTHSDYYAADVDQYSAQAELCVENKEPSSLPAGEDGKRQSVIKFVDKVLFRLHGLGLMEKLSCDRKAARKGGTWQQAGYVT